MNDDRTKDTIAAFLIGLFLVAVTLCFLWGGVVTQRQKRCDAACLPVAGEMIRDECHCGVAGGWMLLEVAE